MKKPKNSEMPVHPVDPVVHQAYGLNKLEHFAGLAMAALLQRPGHGTWELSRNQEGCADDIAAAALSVANEMLKALPDPLNPEPLK